MNARKGFRPDTTGRKVQEEINKLIDVFNKNKWEALEHGALVFIKKNPAHVFGYKALVASLTQQERPQEALEILDAVLPRFPGDTEIYNNRAAALIKLGKFEDAITCAQQAIDIFPLNSGAYANLGLAHKKLGSWNSALNAYRKAIELNPNDFVSLNNAGIALIENETPELAIECFQAALEISPGNEDSIENLAIAHNELKLLRNAKEELEKILSLHPQNDAARSRYTQILRSECLFDEADVQEKILLDRIKDQSNNGNILPFPLLCLAAFQREEHLLAGQRHATHNFGDLFQRPPVCTRKAEKINNSIIRIGYLSADFHEHATVMLMIGMLEKHDRQLFETYIYSYGLDDQSPLRKRVEKACKCFRNIKPLSHLEAAQTIEKDQIDILIDLKGYTKDERLAICALRPAPLIVSWLGYPATLGHPKLADYIIGDPIVTPLDHQPHYSETLALLPHCYQPNDDQRPIGNKPSRTELGLPEEGLVFCSFNQSYKITPAVFSQWCRLLRGVPGSVLWLLCDKTNVKQNLLDRAAQHGVDASRFVFASLVPITEHLGRLQQADLALDTFPYGSHTTGSDALWAGVPLIAIKGDTFASRVSASLLSNANLSELIAESPDAACDLAIALAKDRQRLSELKSRLANTKLTLPLFGTQQFTRDLERMYQTMWAQHQAGEKHPIELPPVRNC